MHRLPRPRPPRPPRPVASPTPAPSPSPKPAFDPGATARARAAYEAGNRKLFAGDARGAIASYDQALAASSSYGAAHRGRGLAYEQLGDKKRALASLRIYVKAFPKAKDADLIRKRIARLEGKR